MNRDLEDSCDEKVFDYLFRIHATDLFNFLYYKYGEMNNPADMVQEAFAKLWKKCKDVHPNKARSFLFTVANNQLLNEISKKKTALKYRSELKGKESTLETPQYAMEEKEYMDKLQNAIEELPEGQRVAFLLNRIEGKKHQEIADMLNISRKAVEKRIYTALAKLREKLGDI